MKYALAVILLVDGAILVWAWRSMRDDFAMVVFALACVMFFGSLPVVLGVITRRAHERKLAARNTPTIIHRPPDQPPA